MTIPPPLVSRLVRYAGCVAIVLAHGCSDPSPPPDPATVEGLAVAASAAAELGVFFVDPVALGDVDGDGFDDLAVYRSVSEPGVPRSVRILFGRAERFDGSFQPDVLVPSPLVVAGDAPSRVLGLGDLDGDGDAEVGVATPGTLAIHFGGPGLRDGSTLPILVQCNPEGSLGLFTAANVGDVDGDGWADLALGESGRIWLLGGDQLVGDGPRNCRDGRLLVDEPSEDAPALARIPGDLDGDGFDDVVARLPGEVLVHRGGEEQSPRVDARFEGHHWVGSPGSVAVGDGRRALLLSDANTHLRFGDPSVLQRVDGSALDAATLEPVSTALACAYQILGDLDGDGLDDIVGYDGNGCGTAGAVRVWYGGEPVPRPSDGTIHPSYRLDQVLAAGDLDGDGFDDVVLVGDDGAQARIDLVYGAPRP